MSEDMAKHVADGVKGVLVSDWAALQAKKNDITGMTVAEMTEHKMKNIAVETDSQKADHAFYAAAEQAALDGKPIAAAPGEHVVTGGVTPPTTVFPAMAKAQGQEVTQAPSKEERMKAAKAPAAPAQIGRAHV